MPDRKLNKSSDLTPDEAAISEKWDEWLRNPRKGSIFGKMRPTTQTVQTVDGPVEVPMSGFGKYPEVVGTELGKSYDKFQRINPRINNVIKKAQFGLNTESTFEDYLTSDEGKYGWIMPPSMLGMTDMMSGDISINPYLGDSKYLRNKGMTSIYSDYPAESVLSHEMTHAAGSFHEKDPTIVENKVRRRFGKRPR